MKAIAMSLRDHHPVPLSADTYSELVQAAVEFDDQIRAYPDGCLPGFSAEVKATPTMLNELWNRLASQHTAVSSMRSLTENRMSKVQLRLKTYPYLSTWKEIFACIERSSFLCGLSSKWSVTWDWIMRSDDNIAKVLEGNYEDRDAPKAFDIAPLPPAKEALRDI